MQNGNYAINFDCIETPEREALHERTASRIVNHRVCDRLIRDSLQRGLHLIEELAAKSGFVCFVP